MTMTQTEVSQTAANQIIDQKVKIMHRVYKKAGSFSLTGVIFAPKNRPNPDEPMSLSQCWLPLGQKIDPVFKGADKYRHPNVMPVLGDHYVLSKVGPILDFYAEDRDWVIQPVLFFYRPKEVANVIGEDGFIKDLPGKLRQLPLDDRMFIDLTTQIETSDTYAPMLDLCHRIFSDVQVQIPDYAFGKDARKALALLVADYPFLIHHIFAAYPNLRLFRHQARIGGPGRLGRIESVSHIVYNKNEIHDPDVSRLMRDLEFPIVL